MRSPEQSIGVLITRVNTSGKDFRIAPDTTDLFKRAMERARAQGRKTIESTDIFDALSNYDSLFVEVLRTMGANPDLVVERIKTQVDEREREEEQYRKKFELPALSETLRRFAQSPGARRTRFRRPSAAKERFSR